MESHCKVNDITENNKCHQKQKYEYKTLKEKQLWDIIARLVNKD
jgi:hypothetical protein